MPGPDGVGCRDARDGPIQQHLQLPAMHRVLRPLIAGARRRAARNRRLCRSARPAPIPWSAAQWRRAVRPDAELVELTHRVGLQVDADAERLQLADGLEHQTRDADLMKRQRDTESSNAAPAINTGGLFFSNDFILTCSVDRPS